MVCCTTSPSCIFDLTRPGRQSKDIMGDAVPKPTVGRVVPLHADQGARSGMHLQVSDHGPSSHHLSYCHFTGSRPKWKKQKQGPPNVCLSLGASPQSRRHISKSPSGSPSSPAPHWAFEKRTETWSQSQDGRQVIGLGTFNLFGDCLGRGPTTVVGLAMHPESEQQGSFATFRATFPIQPDLFTLGLWCICRA